MYKFPSTLPSKSTCKIGSFSAADFFPTRLALKFAPKMLIIEYKRPSNGKSYQKKIKIKDSNKLKSPETVLKVMKTKYSQYFAEGKISDAQLLRLLAKLLKSDPQRSSSIPSLANSSSNFPFQNNKNSLSKFSMKENDKTHENKNPSLFCAASEKLINISKNSKPCEDFFLKKESTSFIQNKENLKIKNSENFSPFEQEKTSQKKINESKSQTLIQPISQEIKKHKNSFVEESINEDFIEDFDDGFDEIEDEEINSPAKKVAKKELDDHSPIEMSELKGVNISRDDLNKIDNRNVTKVKLKMEEHFIKNHIPKNNEQFEYDKRVSFAPENSNEWDEDEIEDDF